MSFNSNMLHVRHRSGDEWFVDNEDGSDLGSFGSRDEAIDFALDMAAGLRGRAFIHDRAGMVDFMKCFVSLSSTPAT